MSAPRLGTTTVSPELRVVVDESLCIVVEFTGPAPDSGGDRPVVGRATITDVAAFVAALIHAQQMVPMLDEIAQADR